MELAGGLRRQKGTDRQKEKNNQETKMRFYGTSSKLLLYNTKDEAGNRIREPIQEPKQQQPEEERKVGRKKCWAVRFGRGHVHCYAWTAYESELNIQHQTHLVGII